MKNVRTYDPEAVPPFELTDGVLKGNTLYISGKAYNTYFVDAMGFYHPDHTSPCKVSLDWANTYYTADTIPEDLLNENWELLQERMDEQTLTYARSIAHSSSPRDLLRAYLNLTSYDLVIEEFGELDIDPSTLTPDARQIYEDWDCLEAKVTPAGLYSLFCDGVLFAGGLFLDELNDLLERWQDDDKG